MKYIKNSKDIKYMRNVCKLASEVLDYISNFIKIGVTTNELDLLCYNYIINVQKAIPGPLNYFPPGYKFPFPKSICTSINDVVCHGIPDNKFLKNGDILNIDITVKKNNYFGDSSRMFVVGETTLNAKFLIKIAYECMWAGISKVKDNVYLNDIGNAIQMHAEKYNFSIVKEFCGHGIGKKFHEFPQILNYNNFKSSEKIYSGMIFTIEPMINEGSRFIYETSNGWTIKTKDKSLSAQWEHTILVTDFGFEVLTISNNYFFL